MKIKPKPANPCTHEAQGFPRGWIDNGVMFAFRTPRLGTQEEPGQWLILVELIQADIHFLWFFLVSHSCS